MPTLPRRTVLAALAVAGGAAACTRNGNAPGGTSDSTQPDPQLTDLAAERALLAAYDATMAAHPDLQERLQPLRAHHADHVTALEQAIGKTAPTDVTPSAVPSTPADSLAALRAAEHAAAADRTRSCVAARADRAPLLGSIAACESSHEVLLA